MGTYFFQKWQDFCMVNNVSRGLFSIWGSMLSVMDFGGALFFFYGNKFGFQTQTYFTNL